MTYLAPTGPAMRALVPSLKSLAPMAVLVAALAIGPAAGAAETPATGPAGAPVASDGWRPADRSSTNGAGANGTGDEPEIRLAQGNCSAAAAQAAAQSGGQVLSVSSRQQNGQTVCVVTVLIPGQDGGRPRRTTITIPG